MKNKKTLIIFILIIAIIGFISYTIGYNYAFKAEENKYKDAYDVQLMQKNKGTADNDVGFMIYNKLNYQYNGFYKCDSKGTKNIIYCIEAPIPTPVIKYVQESAAPRQTICRTINRGQSTEMMVCH